ncbi:MAG TPA: cytochrome C oxidase subunit I, partial [Gammaproteobacteria bacterium]|nr:cytochrome C oxidase subunit I [Gammaproteobacteria bacterium]
LLFGKKVGQEEKFPRVMVATPPTEAQYVTLHRSGNAISGTLLLAGVFLIAFVVYYFINWKYLAETWGMS